MNNSGANEKFNLIVLLIQWMIFVNVPVLFCLVIPIPFIGTSGMFDDAMGYIPLSILLLIVMVVNRLLHLRK